MGEALRCLSVRGKVLISCSIALALASLLVAEKDLLRASILIGLLPLASALVLARTRYTLSCTRILDPRRVEIDHTTRVTLRLRNMSRLPTGTMMLEDRLPYALGSRPRLVLERLAGGAGSSVSYTVRAENRGRYDIGPLVVRLTDPFGLCELTRVFPGADQLTVTPRIEPLPPVRLLGEHAGSGESRALSVAIHGEDDVATREYRHGDDLRRVHWRSTARIGELMVRREEQPWESRATVVLDRRRVAHRGEAAGSSFEWAVSATASIAMHLRGGGYRLRMVTTNADIDAGDVGEDAYLDYLAVVQPSSRAPIHQLVERVRKHDSGGLIVATVGQLTDPEAEELASLRVRGATCVALLADTTTWMRLPEEQRAEADRAHRLSVLTLLRSGWRVVPVRQGDRLPGLWPQLAHRATGYTQRAAMAETITTAGAP